MKNIITVTLLTLLFVISSISILEASAGWLVYSKPEFRGRIVDSETKEPIEGAVIVAMYRSRPIVSGPGGGSSSIIHVKEALTDMKGEFAIPPYKTVIQPNSYEDRTDFIIFKPGYASYPHRTPQNRIYPLDYCGPEILFSKEIGTKGEIRRRSEVISITYGIAQLPRLNTREERLKEAVPSFSIGSVNAENAPLLFEAINKELKDLGSKPIGRVAK